MDKLLRAIKHIVHLTSPAPTRNESSCRQAGLSDTAQGIPKTVYIFKKYLPSLFTHPTIQNLALKKLQRLDIET